ncbi:MAG: hypothetical protein AAF497_02350, partial [Planctomycetota bacterium]
GTMELLIAGALVACLAMVWNNDFALIGAPFVVLFAAGFLWVGGTRFAESGRRVTVNAPIRSRAIRWSAAVAVAAATLLAVLWTNSYWAPQSDELLSSRIAGIDLSQVEWKTRGSGVGNTESRLGGLTLDVRLDPELGSEEGEIFIDMTGPLASLGDSLSKSGKLVFDVTYPRDFSGELQAHVADSSGNSQYGSIAFVERHDAQRRVRASIAPGALTPAMGYSDPGFDGQRPIRRVGLKVSAQSDRVRGRGYRPFQGELTIANVRVIPRGKSAPPEMRTIPEDEIYRVQPVSQEEFLASSGADRPWPLGYAFSGPMSDQQSETLKHTYAALQKQGLGFTRVYLGDYRTGLVFNAEGSVTGIEPQFLDYLDSLAEIANSHGVTVMFSLMDNTLLDGKGVEFPKFIVDGTESNRFITQVLTPIVHRLSQRQVIWDLFNEPENVTNSELSQVQDFVDRALTKLKKIDADAKFTVVSRSADDLIFWRGRGLDVLSHNVFDQRGLESALGLSRTIEVDSPVWIAEMNPKLATMSNLEALRAAGYRGVGIWGWETGDKYDWNADDLEQVVSPLTSAEKTANFAQSK